MQTLGHPSPTHNQQQQLTMAAEHSGALPSPTTAAPISDLETTLAAPLPPSLSNDPASLQPPPEFLSLLEELFSDGLDSYPDPSSLDGWLPNEPTWPNEFMQTPEVSQITSQHHLHSLESLMAASNLSGLNLQASYPPNQDMSFQALVIQPILSSFTQFPLNAMPPPQALNPQEQWAMHYPFTEGVDEWPNDDEWLLPNQDAMIQTPIQTQGTEGISLESVEQTMDRMSLNERTGESSV